MPEPTPYWTKHGETLNLSADLAWNFPEQKSGHIAVIGGNSTNFLAEVKTAEFLAKTFPFLKTVKNIFPDSLKSKLPPLENLTFLPSTDSGSFANSSEVASALQFPENTTSKTLSEKPDFALLLGDFSKNSETAIALTKLVKNATLPLLLTRDAVDLLIPEAELFMNRENLFLVASAAQLQKLFRALFYPKMLLLSSPLLPVVETLHKFTLSYPASILTLHNGEILCASSGKIISVPLDVTDYSPFSLWSGEVAAKIAVFALESPGEPLKSMVAGLTYK